MSTTTMTSAPVRLTDPTLTSVQGGFEPARRPATLDGVRLGLLANGKTHGEFLLDAIAEELSRTYALGEAVRLTKGHPSEPPSLEQVRELTDGCDAVVSAIGDCGSCSSCSVVDGIAMERRGIPSAVLITEPFIPTAEAIAGLNGAAGYRFAVIPHPVTSLSADQLRARARDAAEQVAALLLAAPATTSEPTAAPACAIEPAAIEELLAPYRTGLQTDSADLVVERVDGRRVTLRLIVGDQSCADCIMPASILQRVTTSVLAGRFGDDVHVEVIDPRED
jgi:hypothetical protein